MTTAIDVRGLHKLFSRSVIASRRRAGKEFLRVLFGLRGGNDAQLVATEFWALRNINFSLARGEALGIIGFNGSGKTTLLRILSGQLLPDRGEIETCGTIVPLIDANAGFKMTASGRDNIYLKGAMLGRSHQEMAESFDDIVAFSELGDAIDAPISSYSSGMLMRLAFSINTAVEPDILLIDETLSVGDFRFRQKCLARLRELRERSSFILVSHSMNDIRKFCTRVMVLNRGEMVFEGDPDAAVEYYESLKDGGLTPEQRTEQILKPWVHNESSVLELEHYWCTPEGERIDTIAMGERLHFHVALTLNYSPRHLIMGVPVWTDRGQYVTGFSTEVDDVRFDVQPGERTVFRLDVPVVGLNPGTYVSNFSLSDGLEFLVRAENPILNVVGNKKPHWGVVSMDHQWIRQNGR